MASPRASGGTVMYEVPQQEEDPLGGYTEHLSWVNVANAALILMCAVQGLIVKFQHANRFSDFSFAFICAYMIFFGVMLLGFEFMNSSWMIRYESNMRRLFGFMYDYRSRFAFLCFVAILCFSLGTFGIVTGVITLLNAAVNAAILYSYPKYQILGRDLWDETVFMGAVPTTQYGSNSPGSTPPGEHTAIVAKGAARADL